MDLGAFKELIAGEKGTSIAILATLVISYSGIIVYQWRYTKRNTVPRWLWEDFVQYLEDHHDFEKKKLRKIITILKERKDS